MYIPSHTLRHEPCPLTGSPELDPRAWHSLFSQTNPSCCPPPLSPTLPPSCYPLTGSPELDPRALNTTLVSLFQSTSIHQSWYSLFSQTTHLAVPHPCPRPYPHLATPLSLQVALNLIRVCEMCNEDRAEQASLEEIIGSLFLANEVDKSVVAALWALITPATTGSAAGSAAGGDLMTTNDGASGSLPSVLPGALSVLAMIARLQPDLVTPAKVGCYCYPYIVQHIINPLLILALSHIPFLDTIIMPSNPTCSPPPHPPPPPSPPSHLPGAPGD